MIDSMEHLQGRMQSAQLSLQANGGTTVAVLAGEGEWKNGYLKGLSQGAQLSLQAHVVIGGVAPLTAQRGHLPCQHPLVSLHLADMCHQPLVLSLKGVYLKNAISDVITGFEHCTHISREPHKHFLVSFLLAHMSHQRLI